MTIVLCIQRKYRRAKRRYHVTLVCMIDKYKKKDLSCLTTMCVSFKLGMSALHTATTREQTEIVRMLIRRGCDRNALDKVNLW